MLFDLSTPVLALVIFGVVLGTTMLGAYLGGKVRHLSDTLTEPFGVLQGALLGLVALVLAFGLSLALSRYEDRRAAIVVEANAIGTTFLRAQTLTEPERSASLKLLTSYTESAERISRYEPGTPEETAVIDSEEALQRKLWALAGQALDKGPVQSAPRLYVETLNEMIDAQTARTAALNNQVPQAVLWLEILGAAIALALLAAYLTLVGRGVIAVLLASILVSVLLLVTMDLDRPTRGLIEVPDTVLEEQLDSMKLPPASSGPGRSYGP